MRPGHYGSALEIDHIVSLELGGSNDIANLFPEKLVARAGVPGEGQAREPTAFDGSAPARSACAPLQRAIASNWQGLYKSVFGVAPA